MLTGFDKALLNLLQQEMPLDSRPFQVLADKLDSDESTVLHRLEELKRDGYIRKIGPFFDSGKLGYNGTLVAVKVSEDSLEDVAQAINSYTFVTHNYQREGEYNLWFTLLTPDEDVKKEVLSEIRALDGVIDMMDLVANHKYKIDVKFKLK